MAKKVGKRISHECLLPSAATVGQDEVWACDCGKEYYASTPGVFAGGPRWVPVDEKAGPSHVVAYDKVEEPTVEEVKEEETTEAPVEEEATETETAAAEETTETS
jgi:hypothetical protein